MLTRVQRTRRDTGGNTDDGIVVGVATAAVEVGAAAAVAAAAVVMLTLASARIISAPEHPP